MRKGTGIGRRVAVGALTVFAALLVPAALPHGGPAAVRIEVRADQPGARLDPAMWGVFFEDINFAADGGLCAELVKNRSFEFARPLTGWYEVRPPGARGSLTVRRDDPALAENPAYLRIETLPGTVGYGVGNEGFRGMGLRGGEEYLLSLRVRAGSAPAALRVVLKGGTERVLAESRRDEIPGAWSRLELALRPAADEESACLELTLTGPGRLDIDAVSLLPRRTWKNHGLRSDLMELIADLQPGFVRFPGGCIVEGTDLDNRYRWKETLGERDRRRPQVNRWATAMAAEKRVAPDYYQSYDLGFYELFQLCRDLGAEPLPVVNCGMACQFQSGELAPAEELDAYIQDALDLVEFANGPVDSTWGARRAAMGHPAPFGLKAIAVGNEQWGEEYVERFRRFRNALRRRHPSLLVVGSAGPFAGGPWFDALWRALPGAGADIVDEHYYAPPAWFHAHADRYDGYDRRGPPVCAGEYAAHLPPDPASGRRLNTWEAALAEAAFMTGLERNGDVVRRAAYAPLLAHANAWQWAPNLIWFDNLRVLPSPSYQVQKLFSRHSGDRILPLRLVPPAAAGVDLRLWASATLDEGRGEIVLKVVNGGDAPVAAQLALPGRGEAASGGLCIVLQGARADGDPLAASAPLRPVESAVPGGREFGHAFPARSLTVLRLKSR